MGRKTLKSEEKTIKCEKCGSQMRLILQHLPETDPFNQYSSIKPVIKCENCGFTTADFEKYTKNAG